MQLFDPLSDEEYRALKDNIARHGILVPVELDENLEMLDGYHRLRAWQELKSEGVAVPDYPRIVRKFASEQEKRNHVRALNLLRRHLTKEQREEIWKDMREDGMTLQAIADVSGVEASTVQRALGDSTFAFAKVEGRDGKSRPTHYQKRVSIFANSGQTEKRAAIAAKVLEDAPDKVLDIRRAERIAREQDVQEKEGVVELPSTIDLRLGDFHQVLEDLSDDSVDLIFTDPPYAKEFLPLWSDLAQLAVRVLKPGRLLVTYSGKLYLPEVMQRIGEHLRYVWLGELILPGAHSRVHGVQFCQDTKPFLFYAKGEYEPRGWVQDSYISEGEEKGLHDWQQSLGAAKYYIGELTIPGEIVLDPFVGSGTTGIACLAVGRNFIGAEVDRSAWLIAKERISGQEKA